MCGIIGFWGDDDFSFGEREATLRAMCSAVQHRGPDAEEVWFDDESGLTLGHRRLSILDLSPTGRQPMVSATGRYVISYNGEVYNFREFRRELENGYPFCGTSDTEVMLAAVERWGVHAAVRRFNGMFAFALWDRQRRELHLVRDRIGVKPLYYGRSNGILFFGSQLSSFRAHPRFRAEIEPNALALYLRYRYVPAPWSIYKGIRKQTPGTIVTVDQDKNESTYVYWSLPEAVRRGTEDTITNVSDAADELDRLLRDSVALRMIADVPLGAFLSGGVDSSLIVALMQAQSSRPVKTFSIGFDNPSYNEADYAHGVAAHLHTDHEQLILAPAQALSVIQTLPAFFDEPFADSSQIPTHLVSVLARHRVKVALSGDGGDELFGGYNRHVWARPMSTIVTYTPTRLRRLLAWGLESVSADLWERTLLPLKWVAPRAFDQRMVGYKVHKLSEILSADTTADLYRQVVSLWKDPTAMVPGSSEPATLLSQAMNGSEIVQGAMAIMYLDMVSYLPDDILVKVDRASMAVSLEAREPYLDYRLVEFSWRLPERMKLRDQQGKWLLRQVLYRYVPGRLIDRPKSGFSIPLGEWLRGPLREWADELLSESRLRESGHLSVEPIRAKWNHHLQGKGSWQYHIWTILMFQAWFEHARTAAPSTRSTHAPA